MKNLLFIIFLLVFTSCKNEKQFIPKTENELIESVQVNSQGGFMGYYSHLLIRKDSVLFSSGTAVDSKNISYAVANNPKSWENLVKEINIRNFTEAKDGQSQKPVDGIDTEIAIKTNKKEIKKVNADDNLTWQKISTYSEFYYPQN